MLMSRISSSNIWNLEYKYFGQEKGLFSSRKNEAEEIVAADGFDTGKFIFRHSGEEPAGPGRSGKDSDTFSPG